MDIFVLLIRISLVILLAILMWAIGYIQCSEDMAIIWYHKHGIVDRYFYQKDNGEISAVSTLIMADSKEIKRRRDYE